MKDDLKSTLQELLNNFKRFNNSYLTRQLSEKTELKLRLMEIELKRTY